MSRRVPTIDDLRVKFCYICREEELYDNPENSRRSWTHPCKCTLIAHESCLLQWIQTSQGNPSRAPNALKCPQCASTYELESDNPFILRILSSGNKSLQVMGRFFTVFGVVTVVGIFGTGIYIISTAYGAYALQEFLGKEMFDLLLTDDPSNWSWHALLNLPLIPFSLILSRTPLASQMLPIVPMLMIWPSSTPVATRDLINHWGDPDNTDKLTRSSPPSLLGWPPSPTIFGIFLVPIARILYKRAFSQFSHWVLGTRPSPVPAVRRFVWQINEGGPFVIRIGANVQRIPLPPPLPPPQPPQGQQQAPEPAPGAQQQQQQQQQPEQPAQDQNAEGQAQDAVAAAQQTIEIMTSSIGRLIGGALLVPAIANAMGSLLFRLSKRSRWLRKFLGVRPQFKGLRPFLPLAGGSSSPWFATKSHLEGIGVLKQIGMTLRIAFGTIWTGTKTWAECDPVWWRNSIGLGLFIVAKDCLHLFHLWLKKRELESRHVKNRDFEGVDIRELDLINPFPPSTLAA